MLVAWYRRGLDRLPRFPSRGWLFIRTLNLTLQKDLTEDMTDCRCAISVDQERQTLFEMDGITYSGSPGFYRNHRISEKLRHTGSIFPVVSISTKLSLADVFHLFGSGTLNFQRACLSRHLSTGGHSQGGRLVWAMIHSVLICSRLVSHLGGNESTATQAFN